MLPCWIAVTWVLGIEPRFSCLCSIYRLGCLPSLLLLFMSLSAVSFYHKAICSEEAIFILRFMEKGRSTIETPEQRGGLSTDPASLYLPVCLLSRAWLYLSHTQKQACLPPHPPKKICVCLRDTVWWKTWLKAAVVVIIFYLDGKTNKNQTLH